jgi:hypothetical protein
MTNVTIFADQTPWSNRRHDNTHGAEFIETISYQTAKVGQAAAEEAFHCTNAPEEILSEGELTIASYWGKRRSLSVGDVVSVDGVWYRCESFGWKIIEKTA